MADVMGVNITKYKIFAFVISTAIAGLAGYLYAHFVLFITPYDFVFTNSTFAATPFSSIMSYTLHVLFGAQQLGTDYPEGPLTSRWNAIPGAQQTAINTWLASRGLLPISGNPQLRDVVNQIARANYGGILFGARTFPAWTG